MGIKPLTREYKIQESEDARVRHRIPNKVSAGKLSAFLTVVVICQDFSSLSTCKPFAPQSMLKIQGATRREEEDVQLYHFA